jgi:hypothetical protein
VGKFFIQDLAAIRKDKIQLEEVLKKIKQVENPEELLYKSELIRRNIDAKTKIFEKNHFYPRRN